MCTWCVDNIIINNRLLTFFEFETDFEGLKSGNIENRPGTKKTICTVAALWWQKRLQEKILQP